MSLFFNRKLTLDETRKDREPMLAAVSPLYKYTSNCRLLTTRHMLSSAILLTQFRPYYSTTAVDSVWGGGGGGEGGGQLCKIRIAGEGYIFSYHETKCSLARKRKVILKRLAQNAIK